MPVPYAHPIDVLRRFDPSLTLNDISSQTPIGIDNIEQVAARIRAASQDWDQDTGTPLRLRRVGSPGSPRTYEYHDARQQRNRFPLRVDLDNADIVPLDPNAGDRLEVRTGRDDWEDVTDAEGDEWTLLHESGRLKLFRLLVNRAFFEAPDERYLRATYRFGALGGDRDRGGQTTLASDVQGTDSTLSVANAGRLPADGGIVLLYDGDPTAAEYVRVTDVDWDADELTVSRGANRTDGVSHDSGTTVHYCPEDVRDAVAAYAAAELVRYDLSTQRTDSDDLAVDPSDKLEDWEREWDQAKARYSAVRTL